MEVTKISPQGYCKGVIVALKKCISAINDSNLPRPIYLLGMPIHNKKVSAALEKKGLIVLKDKKRLAMLDEIQNGTVIISAHGASKHVFEKAMLKGLTIIDATCDSVRKIQDTLRKTNKHILYIGTNGHSESEAILTEFNNVTLIENNDAITNLNADIAYLATNQTTMSIFDTEEKYQKIKDHCHNVETINLICNATTQRQKALMNQTADLIVIVGDRHSSNTQKLFEIALSQTKHQLTIKVETVEDLASLNLTYYQTAIVTSGASTPKAITNEIVEYLQQYPNKKAISNLTTDDYLTF